MNAVNYDRTMREILRKESGKGKKLLLHACCAPCSSACLERLKDSFAVTVLFYNPNIAGEEYFKRKREMTEFLRRTGWADFIDCDHDEREFYGAVSGLESCKEGGERCTVCFRLRLEKTAEAAKREGYDYFATTLTLSPLKDAQRINAIGVEAAEKYGVSWLFNDFKKQNGYLRSLELSKQYGLYRQNYCGCAFSLRDGTGENYGH